MAQPYSLPVLTLPGLRANSTGLATSQFLVGKLASTAGQVILNGTSAFAGNLVGIIMNKPGPNEEVEFLVSGVGKLVVSTSTIVPGDVVGCNTTSKGTDGSTTDNGSRLGKALQASAAANDIISVLLIPGGWRY